MTSLFIQFLHSFISILCLSAKDMIFCRFIGNSFVSSHIFHPSQKNRSSAGMQPKVPNSIFETKVQLTFFTSYTSLIFLTISFIGFISSEAIFSFLNALLDRMISTIGSCIK